MSTAPTYAAGFLIPMPLGVWRSECTTGEAGAGPGTPEPQERTNGSLPLVTVTPSGPQTAGTELQLRWVSPGFAPRAGYVVREAADTNWQGRDTPLLGVVADKVVADSVGITRRRKPHGIALPNGTRLIAYESSAIATGVTTVQCAYRTASATSCTSVQVAAGQSYTYGTYPCLLYIEGAVLLFHWNTDTTALTAQVDCYQSLDSGLTWTAYQKSVLPATISVAGGATGFTLGRLRAGYLRGQILLLADVLDNDAALDPRQFIYQYASADRGGAFVQIDTVTNMGKPDIAEWDGRLFCAMASVTSNYIECRILGNAWTQLTSIVADTAFIHSHTNMVSESANAITFAEHALAVLEGAVYSLAETGAAERSCQIIRWAGPVADREIDNLGTGPSGSGYGAFWLQDAGATATDYLTEMCAFGWRGRICVPFVPESSAGTFDDQLFMLELGGNSTITSPYNRRFHGDKYQACYDRTYMPTSLPTVARYGWTGVGAGTESITTTECRLRLTTVAASRYYTYTVTTANITEARIGVYLKRIAGGDVASADIEVAIRWATVGEGYEASIRFSGTQARLYDVHAAATVATVTVDTTVGVYVLLAIDNTGKCTAGVAPEGEQHERKYEVLANGVSLTDDAGAGGTDNIFRFGNRALATATSEWAFVGIAYDSTYAAVTTLGSGQTNPTDLAPIPAGLGRPSFLGEGVSAVVRGGPAWVGDQINIPAAPAYAFRNLLARGWTGDAIEDQGGLAQSPASGYRTSVTGSPASYRVAFQHPSRAVERPTRGFLACHIIGANTESIIFEGYNAGWSTLNTMDLSTGGLDYALTGAQLRATGTSTTYLRTNAAAGGYAKLVSGLTVKYRPILRNTGGPWGAGSVGPLPVIHLDPTSIDGTEPATGTLAIIWPAATLILPHDGSTSYRGYALRWASAPSTATSYEGDYRIKKAVIGELWALKQPDWGYTRRRVALTDIETLESGRRVAHIRGGRRQILELPYTSTRCEGFAIDLSNYATWFRLETSGAIVGMSGAEVETIEGVVEELEGGATPGVYLPYIVKDGGARTLRSSNVGIYGRLMSQDVTWQLENGNANLGHYAGARLLWEQEL